ncbi:MAG TPA: diacylglycerol kinase family protein [Polyangia bacterium]
MQIERPVVIVNPKSGGGLSEKRWAALLGPLTDGLGPFDARFTEAVGDGSRLAREEALAGRRLLVAFGGDGTISEVTDGIVGAGGGPDLGIIPRGTGGDFRRCLALPSDVVEAAKHLREAPRHVIDVGRATYTTADGGSGTRHFVNVASFGFSAEVGRRANESSKKLGAKLSFLGATLSSLTAYDNVEVTIAIDGGEPQRRTVFLGAIGNGSFFGGGMNICPGSSLDDGLFDVVVVGDYSRMEVLRRIPRIYAGTHITLEHISSARARRVEVAPVAGSRPIPIELDGETPGFLPATFEIVPRAIGLRF